MAQKPEMDARLANGMEQFWKKMVQELRSRQGSIEIDEIDPTTVKLTRVFGDGPAGNVDVRYDLGSRRVHYSAFTRQHRGTDMLAVEGRFGIVADERGGVRVDRDGQTVTPAQLAKFLLDLLNP